MYTPCICLWLSLRPQKHTSGLADVCRYVFATNIYLFTFLAQTYIFIFMDACTFFFEVWMDARFFFKYGCTFFFQVWMHVFGMHVFGTNIYGWMDARFFFKYGCTFLEQKHIWMYASTQVDGCTYKCFTTHEYKCWAHLLAFDHHHHHVKCLPHLFIYLFVCISFAFIYILACVLPSFLAHLLYLFFLSTDTTTCLLLSCPLHIRVGNIFLVRVVTHTCTHTHMQVFIHTHTYLHTTQTHTHTGTAIPRRSHHIPSALWS